jgi:putative membrane protein
MVVWDFSQEPMWSTIGHFWIWRHGGPYFGVPITNFLGWFLTNYIIFRLFALYLSRRSFAQSVPEELWRLLLISYLVVIAAGIVRSSLVLNLASVSDAAGVQWKPGYIALTSGLASLFLMGAFAFLACRKLRRSSLSDGSRVAPAMLSTKAASD